MQTEVEREELEVTVFFLYGQGEWQQPSFGFWTVVSQKVSNLGQSCLGVRGQADLLPQPQPLLEWLKVLRKHKTSVLSADDNEFNSSTFIFL